jgi:ABC-type Co2+ transport system permease subunit
VDSSYTRDVPAERTRHSWRVQTVSLLGLVTAASGLIWSFLQPSRLTLLHPRGQGFWWLVLEPQVLVVVAGLVFTVVVARPLLADLEAHDAASR